MRGSSKLTGGVRTGPLKNGRLLSGEERHAPLPGSRLPQCRSTTMVVTNQDDVWGKDHAINGGVCGRRVTAAGLTGRGLQWHGSIYPEVWGNKLWDFASEGVDSVTMAEGDRRREESRVVAASAVVHYAPGDSPLCGLEGSPEPMTPTRSWCGDAETVLSWWPRTCRPERIHGPLPPLQSGNPCQGWSRLASGGPESLPALRQTGVVKR